MGERQFELAVQQLDSQKDGSTESVPRQGIIKRYSESVSRVSNKIKISTDWFYAS